jgi:hypothetical protein
MRISLISGIVALTAIIALPLAAQAQNIDTTGSWNGSQFVFEWGSNATLTYGQSITAPGSINTLDTFGFRLAGSGGSVSGTYRAYVYAWDAMTNQLVGSALWDSGTQSLGTIAQDVFVPVNFAPNIAVTPGNTYMLFASTVGETGTTGVAKWGFDTSNPYASGAFAFADTFSGTTWFTDWQSTSSDTAFTATFSSSGGSNLTPELPGGALLLPALLPFGLMAARKRFKKAA